MILGSTDTGFRKACLLAIIDNSDASIPFLRETEFREDLQTLLTENRQHRQQLRASLLPPPGWK